jgi:hypothetical protein
MTVLIMTVYTNGQILLTENFNYPASDTLKGSGSWFRNSASVNDVKVKAPGLLFDGYGGSGVGNAAWFNNKPNGSIYVQNLVKMDTGTVYLSYLMNVDSMAKAATDGYNVAMDQYGGNTNVNLHSNIQRVNDSTYRIGVTKSQIMSYVKRTFSTKKTYLVILKYSFVPGGASNDSAKVFVFSSGVPLSEPSVPDTFIVSGNDAADIGEIWLANAFVQTGLQGSSLSIDGIKVGRTWNNIVTSGTQTNLTEDFNYATGDTLRGVNGWNIAYPGTPMFVGASGLSFTGYAGSGIGKALTAAGGGASQHPYHTFSSPLTGSLYFSFMTRLSGTDAQEGFIASLSDFGAVNFRAMVYAKVSGGVVSFGLRPTFGGTKVYDTTKYVLDKTYLIIVKYTYVAGSNNDEVSMYVIGNGIPSMEPGRASVGPLIMPNDNLSPGSVVLSPGALTAGVALNGATVMLDGIRVTSDWQNGLTGVRSIRNGVPDGFILEQNYPNPFNPATTIGFTLPASGFTTLTVYDAVGREIAVLVNGMKDAGSYSVQFDGTRHSSGVYFVRMTAGAKSEMKKMLLIK